MIRLRAGYTLYLSRVYLCAQIRPRKVSAGGTGLPLSAGNGPQGPCLFRLKPGGPCYGYDGVCQRHNANITRHFLRVIAKPVRTLAVAIRISRPFVFHLQVPISQSGPGFKTPFLLWKRNGFLDAQRKPQGESPLTPGVRLPPVANALRRNDGSLPNMTEALIELHTVRY